MPPGHGKPRSCTPPPRTGDVAALVHLDVGLVTNDISAAQLQMQAHSEHRVNSGHPKKRRHEKFGFKVNLNARVAWEVRGAGATALRGPRRPAMVFARNRARRGDAWAVQTTQAGDIKATCGATTLNATPPVIGRTEKKDHEGYLGAPPDY